MDTENIVLSSSSMEIAEENDSYLETISCLAYYDAPNLNGVILPYEGHEEQATEIAQTLVNQPVVAKYRKYKGQDDLGSHEMTLDKEGKASFGTACIGTHLASWIENKDVVTVSGEPKNLPCLFAKARIWKRNKNVVAAIKRLYESPQGLGSSWEISTRSYNVNGRIKTLDEYSFEGNCLLGSRVTPAYAGTSKTIAIASEELDAEVLLSEAILKDNLIDNNETKEDLMSEIKDIEETQVTEVSEDTSSTIENTESSEQETVETTEAEVTEETHVEESTEEPEQAEVSVESEVEEEETSEVTTEAETQPETSEAVEDVVETASLTASDLMRRVAKAIDEAIKPDYGYIEQYYPSDNVVIVKNGMAETEADYLRFTYSVGENDEVTISEPEHVKLTFTVAEAIKKVDEMTAELATKNEAIVNASEEIESLKAQIAELTPYKEKADAEAEEKMKAEIAEKKARLQDKMRKGGFAEEEIASEEINALIENMDVAAINTMIADRYIASLESQTKKETNELSEAQTVTASIEKDEADTDVMSFMNAVLFN